MTVSDYDATENDSNAGKAHVNRGSPHCFKGCIRLQSFSYPLNTTLTHF